MYYLLNALKVFLWTLVQYVEEKDRTSKGVKSGPRMNTFSRLIMKQCAMKGTM